MKQYSNQLFCVNSYQDGYFNGDYGTDEDDLINQCWKFYSHDTDHCTHECIALGDAQGTITEIKYGKKYYGMLLIRSSLSITLKQILIVFGFLSC